MRNNEVKALLATIMLQVFFMVTMFVSFLLDPLLGVWSVGIYWIIVSSCVIYHFLCAQFKG